MPQQMLFITVCGSAELQGAVQRLASAGGTKVGAINQYIRAGSKFDLSSQMPAGVMCIAFVDLSRDKEAGLETAEYLSQLSSPRIWPVAVAQAEEANLVLRAMRAGCSEFLAWPASDDQITKAIENINRRSVTAENEAKRNGRLAVFIGVRGGTGATTLAIHAALSSGNSEQGSGVLLVDLHRQLGHVAVNLNLGKSDFSFQQLVEERHRLDTDLLNSMCVRHDSGVMAICSPDDCSSLSDQVKHLGGYGSTPDPAAIERVLSVVRHNFDTIIVDADPMIPETVLLAQRAERVYLVTTPDVASMRDVARYSTLLGHDPDRQRVVVTHANDGVLTPAMVGEAAQLPVVAVLPDLSSDIRQIINAGQPVPQKIRGFYTGLNAILADFGVQVQPTVAAPKSGRGGLFGFGRR